MINYLNKRWLGITIFHIISRFSFSDWTTCSIRLRDTHTQLPWSTSELTKFLDGIKTRLPYKLLHLKYPASAKYRHINHMTNLFYENFSIKLA